MVSNHGSKVAVSLRDNASIGKSFETSASFPKMVCDHKMYDVYITLTWAEMHGKCDADRLFGLLQQLMALSALFSIEELVALAMKIMWRDAPVEGHVIAASGLSDWGPYFSGQNTTKYAPEVNFKAFNPHIMAYFGAHLDTQEKATAALPEGTLREYFKDHYKAPGYVSMQQWEGSPIKWVFVGNKAPMYVAPLPRVRLLGLLEYLARIPIDVIKTTLEEEGVVVTNKGNKASCVAQLMDQSEAVHNKATQAWLKKQAASKASAKAPQKVSALLPRSHVPSPRPFAPPARRGSLAGPTWPWTSSRTRRKRRPASRSRQPPGPPPLPPQPHRFPPGCGVAPSCRTTCPAPHRCPNPNSAPDPDPNSAPDPTLTTDPDPDH